ncbi:nucleic-acid-binding protein from transposon X-element [Trichonephila clavipes]|nr:nucleic-acid-binding protein from transposon X-element [Trichonephila clavipes]
MEESSDPPPVQPKPIMLRIVKDYNLIIQEINRKFPATVNKMTGNNIKVQPGSIDDHRDITALLEARKAEHYVIDRLANRPIKVVIKGLPVDTNVAGIETDLVQKGFAIEKVAQLRKFSTKAPLPIYMAEVRRTETAQDIYEVNNVCYLCVTIDPFRRKPGITQCYNCNYFNHSSKNCKMNPRCLKFGENHRTGECTIKEKIEKPKCINCNEEGHVASLRSCSAFPKIKPKKGEASPSNNKTQNKVNTLPKTRPVDANISFASVCSGKINQKMVNFGDHKINQKMDHKGSLLRTIKSPTVLPPKVKGLPPRKTTLALISETSQHTLRN